MTLIHSSYAQTENSVSSKTNYIDSIQNAKQITDLLLTIDSSYKEFKLKDKLQFRDKKCQKLSDSLKVLPWTKADFDNNGLTDILVVGKWYDHSVLCILDKQGKYEIKRITRRSFQDCTFPIVEKHAITYYYEGEPESGKWNVPRKLIKITLIYKFGDFIEENQTPSNHKIEKIEYATTGCYGTCPIFKLSINSDKTAKWDAVEYNDIDKQEWKGKFQTVIAQDKFEELTNLLNYIDFETLKDRYAVNWTDDQSSILTITYDNGKVKSISDYGLIGTFGLDRIYQLLFELRENQKWTK